MPLKRPAKRGGDEDDGRAAKRAGKKHKEPTYDTYDEALDGTFLFSDDEARWERGLTGDAGGVEMEEKGERYRDGDKALRFYERALELYTKAIGFHPGGTYDAAYNRARVQYTLGTAFHLPPTAMDHLRTSIDGFRTASSLTEVSSLQLDSGYNLAQSLSALADMLEETQEADSVVRPLREEAAGVLAKVLDGQEQYLSQQGTEEEEETMEVEPAEAPETEAEAGADAEEDGGPSFETYLPTPSTLIDTALAIVDLHISMWESVEPLASPSETSQSTVRSVLDRAAAICPADRQTELDLAEIKVLLAVDGIVWDLYRGEAQVGSGVENSLDGATAVLSRLLAQVEGEGNGSSSTTVRAEILTTLAETHETIADRQIFLNPQLPLGASHLAQQAWYNLSQTVTHLSAAADLPFSPDTPREFKPSTLLGLARASLERARLWRVNDTAKRNAPQLMENAWTYASRAADTLGWKSMSLSSTSTLATAAVEMPSPAGWDSESLGRDIVFTALRICFVGAQTEVLAVELRPKYENGLKTLLGKLAKMPAARRIRGADLKQRADELQEDEKLEAGAGESEFWAQCIAQLDAE